jgi:hypothetical protein
MASLKEATQPRDITGWSLVSNPAVSFARPALPTSADPEFSPLSIAPIPPAMGTETDALRQFYRTGVSQIRMPPLPPAAAIAVGATAQSQAEVAISASSSGTPGSLQMPSIFTVSGALPFSVNGKPIIVSLAPELANTVLAGPIASSPEQNVDQTASSNGSNGATASTSTFTPTTSSNEFAIFAVAAETSVSGAPTYTPASGWTQLQPTVGSNGQGLSWYQNTVGANLTPSVAMSPNSDWVAISALFYAESGPPTVVQNAYSTVLGPGAQTVSFGSSTTPGNAIIVLMEDVNGTSGTSYSTPSDTQGNTYTLLGHVTQTGGFGAHQSVAMYIASNIVGGADTISFTQTGGTSGQGVCWIAEVFGLSILSAIPTFRLLVMADLPTSGNWSWSGTFTGNVRFNGEILDGTGSAGTNGQVLTSTGTGVEWENPASGSGGAIVKTANYLAQSTDNGKMLSFNTATSSLVVSAFSPSTATGSQMSVSTGTFATSTGDLIVVGIRVSEADLSALVSVTDLAGNTYTAIPGSLAQLSIQNQTTQLFYSKNSIANASNQVTALFSNSVSFRAVCAWDITDADTSSPLDTSAIGVSNTAVTTITSAAFTTVNANEILIAMASFPQLTNTFSAQSGYTLDSAGFPPTGQFTGAEHDIVSLIQTGVTTSMSNANSGYATISVATFIAGSSGGSLTLTLPASPPSSTWAIFVNNWGTGTLSIDPNGLLLNGSASTVTGITQNEGVYITTDGTNYFYY